MQRSVQRSVVVALTVALIATIGGPASALIARNYRGETSQGSGISAKVISREGRAGLKSLKLRQLTLTCEDASELRWGIGIWWGGRGVRLGADHVAEWDDNFGAEAFSFRGRFWPGHARGQLRYTVAMLTAEEEAMVCTTGDLTWEMQRVLQPVSGRWDSTSLDGVTRVRVTADGDLLVNSRQL